MKSFFHSMGGRVFLILMLGILASAILTQTLADQERHEVVRQIRSRLAAERIEQMVLVLELIPQGARADYVRALRKTGFDAVPSPGGLSGEADPEFARELERRLGAQRNIRAVVRSGEACPPSRINVPLAERHCRSAFVTLTDNSAWRLDLPLIPPPPDLSPTYALYWAIFLVSVAFLAYLVSRMATRPLRQLARAANELGKDIERRPLPEAGPREVREAAAAFNSMQTRIRDFVHERTRMLAAIAHDLQTPLTRLRLRLEKVTNQELKEKLISDLSATQALVREGLELARSLDAEEEMELLDVDSLLESICIDAVDTGQDVVLQALTGGEKIMARPRSLLRCITNLIENAVKYGRHAVVSSRREGEKIVVTVTDGGGGIPEDMLEKVFEPFFRLEASRSRDYGGTGLGLTIARNIAQKHGGTLTLRNSPQGGLEAKLELPAA